MFLFSDGVSLIVSSAVCHHLLYCNFLPSSDNISILAYENKKYLLEIKESLLSWKQENGKTFI